MYSLNLTFHSDNIMDFSKCVICIFKIHCLGSNVLSKLGLRRMTRNFVDYKVIPTDINDDLLGQKNGI